MRGVILIIAFAVSFIFVLAAAIYLALQDIKDWRDRRKNEKADRF